MEKRECSYTLLGMSNGAATLENSLAAPQTIKYRVTTWPSNSTHRYTSTWALLICGKWTISTWQEQRGGKEREVGVVSKAFMQELVLAFLSENISLWWMILGLKTQIFIKGDPSMTSSVAHQRNHCLFQPGGRRAGWKLVSRGQSDLCTLWKMEGIFKSNMNCIELFALPTDFRISCISPGIPVFFIASK